ncbi:MAG: GNAT family N-acetyltransferase [Bacteroidales bacterium]|nr:GNAT family N-acetyltransferase [Bacteroidales bacterium]
MIIKKASKDHLDGITEIWIELMNYHNDLNDFFAIKENGPVIFKNYIESLMDSENHMICIAIDKKNRITGYALAEIAEHPPVLKNTRHCVLSDIAVSQKFRHKGIGKQIMEYVINWAKKKDTHRIELQVLEHNHSSIEFYRNRGFETFMQTMVLKF